jgi:hypothetical protein
MDCNDAAAAAAAAALGRKNAEHNANRDPHIDKALSAGLSPAPAACGLCGFHFVPNGCTVPQDLDNNLKLAVSSVARRP